FAQHMRRAELHDQDALADGTLARDEADVAQREPVRHRPLALGRLAPRPGAEVAERQRLVLSCVCALTAVMAALLLLLVELDLVEHLVFGQLGHSVRALLRRLRWSMIAARSSRECLSSQARRR